MKIIRNEKLIKRNAQIGGWVTLAAMLLLLGGLFVNLRNLAGATEQSFYITMIAFVGGFVLMQVGLYLGKRFGGRPRPDETLDAALKGLPNDYTIYHFTTPVAHLLVGPAGVWALLPYRQRGLITYNKNRWRINNGGFAQNYMSVFGQEGIGRPDLESESQIMSVNRLLTKSLGEGQLLAVRSVLIFHNEQAEIQAEDAPIPTLKPKQLKEFFRQKAKERPINQAQLAAVKATLPE